MFYKISGLFMKNIKYLTLFDIQTANLGINYY